MSKTRLQIAIVLRQRCGSCFIGLALLLPATSSLHAQRPDTTSLPRIPLFTHNDAYLAAFFLVGTVALAPFDKHIAGELQQPAPQTNRFLQNLSTDVRVIAVPGAVIIGTSMYVVGRVTHVERLADLGLHGEEAIGVATVVNTAIKWTAGRARPFVVKDTNPWDYQLFRGLRNGRDYSSFPSGHAMSAFAAAAAVSNEVSRWWPQSRWYVGTAMYGGATLVALSRLYNNQHWASDVIMAAGIGTFAGNKVVRFNHRTDPNNRVDRWLLSTSVQPTPRGGFAIVWSLAPGGR